MMPVSQSLHRELWSPSPSRAQSARMATIVGRPIPTAVRWSALALAASLPFEAASLGFTSSSFSFAKLSGLLFIASYFFFYNPLSGKRSFPACNQPLRYFLVYLLICLVHGLFLDSAYWGQYLSVLTTTAQLLLLFWTTSSLLQNSQLARQFVLVFAVSSTLLALGMLLALPGFTVAIESRMGERITSLEYNPNFLAFSMALAALIAAGIALEGGIRQRYQKWLLLSAMLPLLAIVVRTGSRAGIVGFALAFAVYFFPSRAKRQGKTLVLLAIAVVTFTSAMIVIYPTILTRFEESYAGNIVNRRQINQASLSMVLERPLLGWHPVALWEELGRRTGQVWGTKDAHNSFFYLLLEVGVIGAIPYIIGIYLCLYSAWRGRNGPLARLPMALMVCVLCANLAHTYLTRKPQWLVLALAAAVGSAAAQREKNHLAFSRRQSTL